MEVGDLHLRERSWSLLTGFSSRDKEKRRLFRTADQIQPRLAVLKNRRRTQSGRSKAPLSHLSARPAPGEEKRLPAAQSFPRENLRRRRDVPLGVVANLEVVSIPICDEVERWSPLNGRSRRSRYRVRSKQVASGRLRQPSVVSSLPHRPPQGVSSGANLGRLLFPRSSSPHDHENSKPRSPSDEIPHEGK